MIKSKKGFTLIELIVAVSILLLLFIGVYDLYMKGFSIYKDSEKKSNIEMDVKNFADSLYSYLKSSYQNSIEVGSNKTENLSLEEFQKDKNIIFMAIPDKNDPLTFDFDSNVLKSGEEENEVYSYNGMIEKILSNKSDSEEIKHLSGNQCETHSDKPKSYHYIMYQEKNGYIEIISNILSNELDEEVEREYSSLPGNKTKALNGVLESFKITPEYISYSNSPKLDLSKLKITLKYKVKNQENVMVLDYVIRN